MNVYLAGKVAQNGWRTSLVGGARLDAAKLVNDEPWPVLKGAIFGEHDYVGPFLYGCDCGHCFSGATHGAIVEEAYCLGHSFASIDQDELIRRCFDAIRRADLVFCWIDAAEDYGSMVELGYALGIGKLVVVGLRDRGDPAEDRWFARFAAAQSFFTTTPEGALQQALCWMEEHPERLVPTHSPQFRDIPMGIFSWCESPIESRMLTGLVNAAKRRGFGMDVQGVNVVPGARRFSVSMQVSVVGHRVDFLVARNGTRAVVECDGHDYHERTKEQAKRDRSADRAYQKAGYAVLRFTGSEIYRNAEGCAVEVFTLLGAQS